tara:strand:- start:6944 stop:8617 length:1674 start_codon:yes stop_codon:yes gene_type:complete
MLRTLIAFLHIISFSFIFTTDVNELKKEDFKAEINTPEIIEKGSEGIVEIKFTKGTVKGFAKLTDNFPQGVIAEAVDMGDATFTFSNGVLKIIWLNFPTDNQFSVKYKVKVDQSAANDFDIGGKFSYLENNEKRSYSIFKKSIATGVEALASKTKTELKEEEIAAYVEVIRTVETLGNDKYQVTLDITKQGIEGFCKIQEFTSFGGIMSEVELKGAIFSFIKNKGKFVWMSLPTDENFTVSYSLDLGSAKNKDVSVLKGDFSFLEGNVTKKVDIIKRVLETLADNSSSSQNETVEEKNTKKDETIISTENEPSIPMETSVTSPTIPVVEDDSKITVINEEEELDTSQESMITSDEEIENKEMITAETLAAANRNEPKKGNTEETLDITSDSIKEEVIIEDDILEETPVLENIELKKVATTEENEIDTDFEAVKEEEVATIKEEKPKEKKTGPVLENNFGVRTGVNYRVQIAAGKNVVDKAYFEKRHNWTSDFVIENHKGWIKYTTGSYQIYRIARDNRATVNGGEHKFNGPFVTAYNEGIRITVQEALMISKQKWFK